MGKAVGRLLAEKGANVIIVARNVEKLKDALKYISVCPRKQPISKSSLIQRQGTRFKILIPALPLHQRRPDRPYRSGAHHFRNNGMEQYPASRHILVLCRIRSSRPLH